MSFKVGTIVFNYLFFLFLSNFFGASEVGYFALSFTVIQLFSIIARSGLDIGMFKEISYSKNSVSGLKYLQKRAIIFVTLFSIVLLGIAYAFKPMLKSYAFSSELMSDYVLFFLLSLPFYTLMFFNSEIHRAKKHYSLFAVFQNFGMYLLLCLFVAFQKFTGRDNFTELAWFFIVSLAFLCLLSFWGTFDHSEKENKQENKDFKRLSFTSIPIGISTLCFFLMSYFDGLVIGQFFPESTVGIYAIAFKIAILGRFILLSINSAIGPRITELSSLKKEDLLFKELRKTTKMGFWATMPFVLITTLFPQYLLGIFGEEFKMAVIPLLILLFGQLFNTLNGPTGIVLQLTGHQRVFKNVILITAVINVSLNYLLIPNYGLIGAAIVNSLSIVFWNIWCSILVHRIYGKTFFYIPFIKNA